MYDIGIGVVLAKDRMPKAEATQFDLSRSPELTQAVVNGFEITQHRLRICPGLRLNKLRCLDRGCSTPYLI